MPQMAPLMWLNLFSMFVLTYMIFSSLNYFSFLYKKSSQKKTLTQKFSSWKW